MLFSLLNHTSYLDTSGVFTFFKNVLHGDAFNCIVLGVFFICRMVILIAYLYVAVIQTERSK